MNSVGYGAAFLAGLASFLSPCVLPLIPGYLSMISGISLAELSGESGPAGAGASAGSGTAGPGIPAGTRTGAGLAAACFVLGFSVVFTAMGAAATAIGSTLTAHLALLSRVAGVVVVVFGLHLAGAFTIPWLYYEKRFTFSGIRSGYAGAFLMGMAFAFGWSPCIGPILATILALAATQDTVWRGVGLLAVYSLGLGLPFLAAGLAVGSFMKLLARYRPFIRAGEIAAGALLVVLGVMIFLNKTVLLSRLLPESLSKFAR